jgi:diguanylate cyclase (GGDEF)-like protein
MIPAGPGGWRGALPFIEKLAGCLEGGLLLVDPGDGVVYCSEWMADILGLPGARPTTGRQLLDHLARMVPNPPPAVRDRLLLAPDRQVLCEEFEMPGPPRSVVRWVARRVREPEPAVVVVCSDITAEVDLASTRERQAVTDPLTGLLNRRGAEPQIAREIHQAARYATPLGAILLDIDHFKSVNDQHGHAAGDLVLRAVAGAIVQSVRACDIAARWGGEEFLVILPHTPLEGARHAGERIRLAVEGLRMDGIPRVTISGGAACLGNAERLSDLLARADQSLYAAKAGGRNRIR